MTDGTLFIGPADQLGSVFGTAHTRGGLHTSRLRDILERYADSWQIREVAGAWGIDSFGRLQRPERDILEQIVDIVERGRLAVSYLPLFRDDPRARGRRVIDHLRVYQIAAGPNTQGAAAPTRQEPSRSRRPAAPVWRAAEPAKGGSKDSGTSVGKASKKGGSTTIAVDDKNQIVTIKTKMEFSGPGATKAYVDAAKKQIEEAWSGSMIRDGKPYKVQVEIDAKLGVAGTPMAGFDQINVAAGDSRMNQTLFGAGPGNQTAAAATDAKRPRRIAHEYGHTLGLSDGYEDTPDGSKPKDPSKKNDIMSETWPDKNGVLPHPHQDHYEDVLKSHGW
jgi:hypothetical protein